VVELIATGGLLLQASSGSFEDAVSRLVDLLIANGQLDGGLRQGAVNAICQREATASTAVVEIGVAVPHARLAGVAGVVAALAASPTVLYDAMAGVPISIMVVVLSAPERVEEHLNALAGASLLLQSARVRSAVRHTADRATALRILSGEHGHGA
jgi:mannitol/fructose-specific phosphotransferase system IIA component (Ntr-type)